MRARHFPVFVLFFVLILCSCGRSAFAGPVKLIAGTSLITDVLQDLCGGNAEILTLVQGSSCPGHEDVKTGDFVFASHADLIVLHAWQERMPQFTTMLKSIERPDLRKVLLTETGSWLVPDNQREASRQAAAALEKAFPEKAGDVRARLAKRLARIDAAEAEAGNLSVIPNNILQPFVSGNVLSVLIIAAAADLGLAFMPKTPNRDVLLKCINGMQDLLFTLIRALLFILPVGIMAFTGQLVSQIQAGVIVGALGQYTAVIIGGNLLQFFVVIPLFLLARGVNPLRVFRGMSPALAVAFFSKSSAGTLPVTLASAEENLRLDHRVTRFVLPICTTINMNGCAAFILVTSLFLMQNAGIVITTGTMIVWLFVAVLAAVGNAGVPMGCYFLTLSLMSSMNVPVDLMGAILPIYAIIDMIETCVNVWSDSSVATMTDHDLRGKLPPEPAQTEAA